MAWKISGGSESGRLWKAGSSLRSCSLGSCFTLVFRNLACQSARTGSWSQFLAGPRSIGGHRRLNPGCSLYFSCRHWSSLAWRRTRTVYKICHFSTGRPAPWSGRGTGPSSGLPSSTHVLFRSICLAPPASAPAGSPGPRFPVAASSLLPSVVWAPHRLARSYRSAPWYPRLASGLPRRRRARRNCLRWSIEIIIIINGQLLNNERFI